MAKHYYRLAIMFCHFILVILSHANLIGQTIESIKLLKQKFAKADSIVLISHEITEEFAIKILPDIDETDTLELQKWKAQYPTPPKFLINGKLNRKIIQESVSLNDSSRTRLSEILLRKVNLTRLELGKCFQPQHSIVLYKGNNQFYIDICFGCRGLYSSKDIAFNEMNVDQRKWAELKAFFKSNGLTKIFEEYERRMKE